MENLVQRQREREQSFKTEAKTSFTDKNTMTKNLKENQTDSFEYGEVATTVRNDMFKYVRENYDTFYPSRTQSKAKKVVEFVGRNAFSAIVSQELISAASKEDTQQELIRTISDQLLQHDLERLLKELMDKEQVKTFDFALEEAKSTSKVLKKFIERTDIVQELTEKDCIQLVAPFVRGLIEAHEYFQVDSQYVPQVEFTEEAECKIENLTKIKAIHAVKFKPLVAKPHKWEGVLGSVYYTGGGLEYPLIKRVRANEVDYINEVESNPNFHIFLDGINAIQSTPFVINKGVYGLIDSIRNSKDSMFEVFTKHVKENKGLDKSEISKFMSVEGSMEAAKEIMDDTFYMAYDADFRGRIYCKCDDLSPQGSDLQKSLLLFADKVALGSKGHMWLKVHAANCYAANALDKASMTDRVAWVDGNSKLIETITQGNIYDKDFRTYMNEADSPLLLFAVCQELVKLQGLTQGEIENFESNIPVSIDGSNNGLQHYAAILKSNILAQKVNLHVLGNNDKPSDVYALVAEAVTEYYEKTTPTTLREKVQNKKGTIKLKVVKEIRQAWLNADKSLRRKTVKRPVMTQAYAVTQRGIKEQMRADALPKYKTLSKEGQMYFTTIMLYAFNEGLSIHCAAATKGMDFLKDIAKAVEGEFHWTTPSGFTVRQDYKKTKKYQTDSIVAKKRVKIQFFERLNVTSTSKQKSSIAPNYIHSHDSAHMLLTVNALIKKDGFNASFFMIHDSFGSQAGQLEQLSNATRTSFVEMYQVNPFILLQKEAEANGADAELIPKLPPVDNTDTIDINDVLKATYFFC